MDPLSIAASIAGLLSLATSIISIGFTLSSRMNKHSNDVKAIAIETAALSGILLGVEKHLEAQPSLLPDLDLMANMLQDCKNALTEISDLLNKLSEAGRVSSVIKGEAREERLHRLLKRMEQYKSFFILCFHVEHSSQAESTQSKLSQIRDNLQSLDHSQREVEKSVGILMNKEDVKRREELIQWLGVPTDAEHDDLCSRREPESAQWILKKLEFGIWLSSPESSFLWLNGTRGSGKSVIVSKIIETIQKSNSNTSDSALAYHYCRFSNSQSLSPSRLVGSLISQLIRQSFNPNTLLQHVDKLYDKHRYKPTLPNFRDVQELFMELSRGFKRIFIIIDGLDEMVDRCDILDFLENLSAQDGNFKVLVASRTEMDLDTAFSYYCAVTIQPIDIMADIELFVQKQLGRRRFRGLEVEEIVQTLVSRADGMFLWVVCQVKHLAQIRTTITTNDLKALPLSLERTFEQALLELSENDRALATRILQFIMSANRPLDLTELVEGITVTSNTTCLHDIKRAKLSHPRDVFEICSSLIRESQSTGKIELSHYSVYEFLKSPLLEGNRANIFCIHESEANLKLLETCIRYLSLPEVCITGLLAKLENALDEDIYIDPEIFADTPFLEHATSNWPVYTSRLSERELQEIWGSTLCNFFQPSTQSFDFWAKAARYIHGKYKYPPGMTPLHAVAVHGLLDLAKFLLADDHLKEAPWRHARGVTTTQRTPLHVAIENGHDDLFDIFMLPDYIISTDERGRTPLHVALETLNETAVMQLVTGGANVNARETDGRTPAFIAIENCWEDLAELLSQMADVSITMPDGRGLLHIAAQTGSTVWTSKLVEPSLNLLNAIDQEGWTPLHYATIKGHGGVAKILLSNGAYVGIADKNGWTPLHAAIRHQHLHCAKELLVSTNPKQPPGTQSTARGYDHLSPERRAEMDRKYGHTPPLSSPASCSLATTNSAGSSSSTVPQPIKVVSPLFLAVSYNYNVGVDLLLQHATSYGRREIGLLEADGDCLRKALSLPDTKVLEFLLPVSDAQAILAVLPQIATDKDKKVMAAMQRKLNSELVHRDLLTGAIRCDTKQNCSSADFLLDIWPPSKATLPQDILHTVVKEHSHLAARLLDGGADVFFESSVGDTPLQLALQNDKWDIAELILSRFLGDFSRMPSALHAIVENTGESSEAVQMALGLADMVLAHGIDIDDTDDDGKGICHKAAARSESTFLTWALDKGAYPALTDAGGNTPVHIATAFERAQNLDILLNKIIEDFPEDMVRVLSVPGKRKPPLILAINTRNTQFLTRLIDADQMAASKVDDTLSQSTERITFLADALCHAIHTYFQHGIDLLVASTPNVSAPSSGGDTPLHIAVRHNSYDSIMVLLNHGADPNAQHRETGETPHDIAAEEGSMFDVLATLTAYGAKPTLRSLAAAAKAGNMGLLLAGLTAFPYAEAEQRRALFIARWFRQTEVMEVLLTCLGRARRHVVDGVERDVYGDSALHSAVRRLDLEGLRSALSGDSAERKGRLLTARDLNGDTPLMLATRDFSWGCAEQLIRLGANINHAMDWARAERHACALWYDKLKKIKERQQQEVRRRL